MIYCRAKKTLACVFCVIVLIFSAHANVSAQDSSAKDIEQLDFANGLFQRSLYEMAIAEYKKFIEKFPKSEYKDEAHFGIAECHLFMEDYEQAIKSYKNYIKLFPEKSKAILSSLRIGQARFLTGEYDQAFSQLESIDLTALDDQFHPNYYYYLGKTYQTRGDNEKALEFLQKTVDIPGKNQFATSAYFEMADIKVFESKFKEAIPYYHNAFKSAKTDELKGLALFKQGEMQFSLGEYADSIDIFRNVLKNFPRQDIAKDALANILLGFFNISQYKEAIDEYQKNADFIREEEEYFNIHYIAADAYSELKEYDQAIGLIERILKFEGLSEENQHKVFLKWAEVLVKAQRYDEALAFVDKNFKDVPKDRDQILFFQAEAYYGKGDYQEARNFYDMIIEKYSASTFYDDALYGIGHTLNSLEKSQEAMEAFMLYFEKGEDYLKRQQALYNATLMAVKMDLTDKAIEYGELYLSTFIEEVQNKKVLFLLGQLYPAKKNYEKAVDVFKQYVDRFGEGEDAQEINFNIAYNLQSLEKFDEAITYYQKAAQDQNNSKFHYSALKNMGLIFLKKNKEDEALKIFDRIISEFKKTELDLNTFLWVAEKYLNKKNFEKVLDILAKAEGEHVKPEEGALLAYYKAEAYRGLKNWDEAINNFDIVLALSENNKYSASSRIGKAMSLMEKGELDKARSEFEQAIEKNVSDNTITMKARFEIANIERKKNNLDEAAKFYMLVAVLYQNKVYCPKALYSAGEIFEELKKPQEAINVYQEIIDVYADSEFFEKAKKKMESLRES